MVVLFALPNVNGFRFQIIDDFSLKSLSNCISTRFQKPKNEQSHTWPRIGEDDSSDTLVVTGIKAE